MNMKKIFSSALLVILFSVAAFAQNAAYSLYKFNSTAESDIVLKALNLEVKFSDAEFTRMQEILTASARSQSELFKLPDNKNPENIAMIVNRQTTHIEGNLKNLIGEDRYKKYLAAKATIEAKAKELGKN